MAKENPKRTVKMIMVILACLFALGLLGRFCAAPRPPAQLTHEQLEMMFTGLGLTPIPPEIERICVLLQLDPHEQLGGTMRIRIDLLSQGRSTLLKGDLFVGSEEVNIGLAGFRDAHYITGWRSTGWWNPGLAIDDADELTLLRLKTGRALFARKEDRLTIFIYTGGPLPRLHEEFRAFRAFMEGYPASQKFTQPSRMSAYTRCWTMPEPSPQ